MRFIIIAVAAVATMNCVDEYNQSKRELKYVEADLERERTFSKTLQATLNAVEAERDAWQCIEELQTSPHDRRQLIQDWRRLRIRYLDWNQGLVPYYPKTNLQREKITDYALYLGSATFGLCFRYADPHYSEHYEKYN